MKRSFLLLLVLLCVFLLNACVGLTSSTTPDGSTTSCNSNLEAPDFSQDAYLWNATSDAGETKVDSKYRIIIEEGNANTTLAAQVLRLGMSGTLGSSLVTTNDKLDNNPERDKEILLGNITNRSASSEIFAEFAEQLSAYTTGVGSFFIGANGNKIMILAEDDDSLLAAATFFIQNYVNEKDAIVVESDLRSLYFFDKAEFKVNRNIDVVNIADLNKDAVLLGIRLNGELIDGFVNDVNSYEWSVERSEAIPEVSVDAYSPFAHLTVVQPSAENSWTAHLSIQSAEGSLTVDYSIAFSRLDYDTVGATLHKLKNGATGAITLVGDDGYTGTAEIMLEICKKYGAKFNIAMSAKNVGELKMDGDDYLFDANGNYQTNIFSGASWWQQIVEQNADTIEITSHTLTHSTFNGDETEMKAEIYGSQQILRDAFPSQRVLTFAYAGYDGAENEHDMVKAALSGHYIAARGGSSAKHNPFVNHDIYELECCSLYYNNPSTWGTGASNQDGWMMRAINEVCTNGGWVVTMNHMINRTNDGLGDGNITIDLAMFEHVVRDYVAPKMQSGVLWNGFFSEVAQYVTEYNSANMVCKTYEDGVILIDLTDEENDELYDYALTIDVPVDETWTSATLTYTARDGSSVEEMLTVSTANDGSRYVRLQLVPDCGTATLTRGN